MEASASYLETVWPTSCGRSRAGPRRRQHEQYVWICQVVNGDLSAWNVSQVTETALMFYQASRFKSDLNTWNVGRVALMHLEG